MKKLLFILAGAAILAGCSAKTDLAQKYLGLNGRVEKVKETCNYAYEKHGERETGPVAQVKVYTFNDRGDLLTESLYNGNGDIVSSCENDYENGKLKGNTFTIKSKELKNVCVESGKYFDKWHNFDEGGNLVSTEVRDYRKRKIVKEFIPNEYRDSRHEVIYDNNDNIIAEIEIKGADTLFAFTYKYDKKNFLTESILSTEGWDGVYTYEYMKSDDKGNWTERAEYFNGKIKQICTREIIYK